MHRINAPHEVAASGVVEVDAGAGIVMSVPVVPSEGGGGGNVTWATLPGKPDTFPAATHTHTQAQVTGLDTALASKVDTTHPMLYDSGWRDITADLDGGHTSGSVYLRRVGKTVFMHVDALTYPTKAGFKSWGAVVPAGFRPSRVIDFAAARRLATDTGGSIRIDRETGLGYAYQVVADVSIRALGSWVTDEAIPTTPPGDPT